MQIKRCCSCGDWTTLRFVGRPLCITCREIGNRVCKRLTGPALKVLRESILKEFGGRCYYCLGPADRMEHMVPISRGGNNLRKNLAASCARCNGEKAGKTVEEYAAYKKKLSTDNRADTMTA